MAVVIARAYKEVIAPAVFFRQLGIPRILAVVRMVAGIGLRVITPRVTRISVTAVVVGVMMVYHEIA